MRLPYRPRFLALRPIALTLLLTLNGPAISQSAPVANAQDYDLPAAPLASTLNRISRTAGLVLTVDTGLVGNRQASPVRGHLSPEQALRAALANSGLDLVKTDAGTYTLRPVPKPAGGEATLAPVTVEASTEREAAWGPVIGYVAKHSATATKTDTPIIETPQSISIVTRDQMTAQNVQSVSDALRYSAGVLAESNGPDPRADNIMVRGFDTGGRSAFRDGLGSYAFNNQGGTVYEPYGLERIEILRGPSSILYGQGGPGGLVNLVSKRPTAEPVREVQVQFGRHDRKQLAGDLGGKLTDDGTLTYRLTGLVRESDTFIDYIEDDRAYVAPALTWSPDADTSLTLLAEHQRNRRGQGYQALPRIGTLDDNPYGKIPTSRFLGEPDFDRFDQERTSIGYLLEHRINGQLTFRQNARHQTMETKANTIYMTGLRADGRTVGRFGSRGTEDVTNAVIDNQLQWRWQHGSVEHTTLLGFDLQYMRNDSRAYYGAFGDLDVYRPVHGQDGGPLALGQDTREHLKQRGVYLQDQIKIDKTWVATLGLRRDTTRQTTNDHLGGGSTTQRDGATTGRVGLVYLAPMGFAPYVSYSESFVPVVDTTFDGSPFKPETGRQYEVGVRYQPPGRSVSITASVFDLARQNVTTADLEHAGFSTQHGEVDSRGFELEAKANLDPGWDIIASYSRGRAKLTEDNYGNEGNLVANVPKNTAAAWVEYTVQGGSLAGLGLGAGVRYVGWTYRNDENTDRIPAYTLTDLSVRYDFQHLGDGWRGWRAAFNVSNLFDKRYVATCGYYGDGCKYGYRRNAMLTMTYDW